MMTSWHEATALTRLFDHEVGELRLLAGKADVGQQGEDVVLIDGQHSLRTTRQEMS